MTKINQIQNKLLELDGGSFQKLVDSYLLKKGYPQVNPMGSVSGSNKVRTGTPDTLIPLPNGKYAFVEHTTQQTGVFSKFLGDLKKCFNEEKTGIAVSKIEEIVICYTAKTEFTTNELNALQELCEKHSVNFNAFGIGTISYDLLEKFPRIAKDYLDVEVDTGQIVPLEEFVTLYNKNKLATRLDTIFHFRDEEVSQIETAFETNDLIIISGVSGIGKSRLVLECCERFTKSHSEFQAFGIYNRNAPGLFEDIRFNFSAPGNSLIFVDDANRLSEFQYFVQLLQDQKTNQQIKVIVTVRDYAVPKVLETTSSYGSSFSLELEPLSREQIMDLVKEECGVKNHLFLERIAKLCQGNPRLAIMAGDVATKEKTFESLNDVSHLYDKYYVSIRKDLNELENRSILKVAGIVAFFQKVDRSRAEMLEAISKTFLIHPDEFWESVHILHDMEIFDLYENEVVKVSDQILATYLFYLVFFKDRILKFRLLLTDFFPRYHDALRDAIYPIVNAFGFDTITQKMQLDVDHIWEMLLENTPQKDTLTFIKIFWFMKTVDVLIYVQEQIEQLEPQIVDIQEIKFEVESSIYDTPLLEIICLFQNDYEENFRSALELLYNYLEKLPSHIPQVLHCLIEEFNLNRDAYDTHINMQEPVVETLWERTQEGKNELFSRLFIAVAEKYLHTEYSSSEMTDKQRGVTYRFTLPAIAEVFELRN